MEKKLACHPDLPAFACINGYKGKESARRQATGDLCLIEFYYLLRVGEYKTKAKRRKRTRTRQLHLKDITFFKRNKAGVMVALPWDAPEEDIMTADAATLRI